MIQGIVIVMYNLRYNEISMVHIDVHSPLLHTLVHILLCISVVTQNSFTRIKEVLLNLDSSLPLGVMTENVCLDVAE